MKGLGAAFGQVEVGHVGAAVRRCVNTTASVSNPDEHVSTQVKKTGAPDAKDVKLLAFLSLVNRPYVCWDTEVSQSIQWWRKH